MITRQIGLLFVHGIGEQKRFEHLTSSVREFAELMHQADRTASVSIIDRTGDWKTPPGQPDSGSRAPITLTVTSTDRRIVYQCHEVWWADLADRSGILDTIGFWIWGLGQWAAPIFLEFDAMRAESAEEKSLVTMPPSAAGRPYVEMKVRVSLMLTALAALFVLVTWSLGKRLITALGAAPSPTLIVSYVGDVRTYEERATPGESAISDPGQPRRVGIRRRMVTEMVAMADRGLDSWYVVAHSLGTVVAYNGLTEIGHALPNYLPKEQWQTLDDAFKTNPGNGTRLRPPKNLAKMMPARPDWLGEKDVINRPALFQNLKGFLTYGSPLEKFAAMWPRVIATATDRSDMARVFPEGCRWINLTAPHDPVSGRLESFRASKSGLPEGATPHLETKSVPLDAAYVLAHIRYFIGSERNIESPAAAQRREVANWLLRDEESPIRSLPMCGVVRWLAVVPVYLAILIVLWIAAAAITGAAGGLTNIFFDGGASRGIPSFGTIHDSVAGLLGPVLGCALAGMLLCGIWRWVKESGMNAKLAAWDDKNQTNPIAGVALYRDARSALLTRQKIMSRIVAPPQALAAILILLTNVFPGYLSMFAICIDWLERLRTQFIQIPRSLASNLTFLEPFARSLTTIPPLITAFWGIPASLACIAITILTEILIYRHYREKLELLLAPAPAAATENKIVAPKDR